MKFERERLYGRAEAKKRPVSARGASGRRRGWFSDSFGDLYCSVTSADSVEGSLRPVRTLTEVDGGSAFSYFDGRENPHMYFYDLEGLWNDEEGAHGV